MTAGGMAASTCEQLESGYALPVEVTHQDLNFIDPHQGDRLSSLSHFL